MMKQIMIINMQCSTIRFKSRLMFLLLMGSILLMSGCDLLDEKEIARDVQERRQISYRQITRPTDPNTDSPWKLLSGPFSLADCLEAAMLHNKDIQLAKENLLEADGQMTEAIATALPTLSFSGSALWNDNSGFDRRKETYELGLLVRQPIYLGGVIGTAIDAARVFTYQQQQRLRRTIQSVQHEVRKNYLHVLLSDELVEVQKQALEDAEKHLEDTRKKLKYGTATRFELLQAQVNVTSNKTEYIRRQNDAQIAMTQLLDSLGISQNSGIELTGILAYEPPEPGSGDPLAIALRHRPDLLIGEANIRLYKDNLEAQKAGTRPRIYLQGQYARSYPGFGSNFSVDDPCLPFDFGGGDDWERTMNVGVVVEWNIFDGFATDGKIAQAKAQLHQQQINLRKLEQKVQYEITQARLNLQSAEQFVLSQQGNVENAEEALRLAQVGYREGTLTSLDVISAETSLAQARSEYFRAIYNYELSQLALKFAMGTLGEDSELFTTHREP